MNKSLPAKPLRAAMHPNSQEIIAEGPAELVIKRKTMLTTTQDMTTPEQKLPSIIGIITPPALAALVARAPDKDLLLAIKLVFHLGVPPATLEEPHTVDGCAIFLDSDHSDLRALLFNCFQGLRHVYVDPIHSPTLRVLLPRSGPLFHSFDPYGRVQHFAAGLGIHLTRGCATRSWLLYGLAVGLNLDQLARDAGILPRTPSCRHPYCPISREQAAPYWAVYCDLDRLARLPRYVKRLTQ